MEMSECTQFSDAPLAPQKDASKVHDQMWTTCRKIFQERGTHDQGFTALSTSGLVHTQKVAIVYSTTL